MPQDSNTQLSDEWKVSVANSIEEIEAIRPSWERMQQGELHPTPNGDIDRYVSVIKASGGELRPRVMLLERNGYSGAMLISWVGEYRLKLRLGYKTLFDPRLRCLSVVYGGILGRPNDGLSSLLVGELVKQLRSDEIDMVYFNHLRTDTIFYRAVRRRVGFLCQDHFPKINEHWRMVVPEDSDQFYMNRSGRHRRNLRRYIRKFEEQYHSQSNLIKYTSEDDVADFIRMAAEISSKTYQSALGVGIVNDERTRSRIAAAARLGWLDGNILFAGGVPCAFQVGFRYKRVYFLWSIGYDPAFSSYRPGTLLFLKVLDSLCDDSLIDTIDFYFGDAEYKRHYGTEHWPEVCVCVFAPRLYPVFLNVLYSSMEGMSLGLKHVLDSLGLVRSLKRRWRSLLRPKESRITRRMSDGCRRSREDQRTN
jgi:hypothetical protein